MTLRIIENNLTTPNFAIMSSTNPNLKALKAISKQEVGYKTIHIGHNHHPVRVMMLPALSAPSWKRTPAFQALKQTTRNLSASYPIADLITSVTDEMPISTDSTFAEAEEVAQAVHKEIFNVHNLEGHSFMIHFYDIHQCPAGLTYMGFRCDVDGKDRVDERIMQNAQSFLFSLKFPQMTYNTSTKTVSGTGLPERGIKTNRLLDFAGEEEESKVGTTYTMPQHTRTQDAEDKEDAEGSGDNDETSEEKKAAKEKKAKEAKKARKAKKKVEEAKQAQLSATPKMTQLLGTSKTGSVIRVGYFGPLDFLDKQEAFDTTFGTDPTIYCLQPMRVLTKEQHVREQLNQYAEECKMDVFLAIYRNYYVRDDAAEDDTREVEEIVGMIVQLKQTHFEKNKQVTDHPDVLFSKFLNLLQHSQWMPRSGELHCAHSLS